MEARPSPDTFDAAGLLRWSRSCRDLVARPDRVVAPNSAYGASMLQSTLEWLVQPRTWRPIGPRETAQREAFRRAVRRRRGLGMPATPDDVIAVAEAVARSALGEAGYDPVVEHGIGWGMRMHAWRVRRLQFGDS